MSAHSQDHSLGPKRRSFLQLSAAAVVAAGLPIAAGGRAHADGGPTFTAVFTPSDPTSGIQAALDAAAASGGTAATVVIPDVGQNWVTDPLLIDHTPISNGALKLTVLFQPGVTVQARPGAYPDAQCLLTIDGGNAARSTTANRGFGIVGVTLSGYGATLAMNKSEYTTGEQRHVIKLVSAGDIWIEGLTLRDSGGDGIAVTATKGNYAVNGYCGNVTVVNVHCDNNRRNGMSVNSCDGMTVSGSAFTNSNGTGPSAGIDFEPDQPLPALKPPSPYTQPVYNRLANITVTDCFMGGNVNSGVLVQSAWLTGAPTTSPIGITLDRILIGPQQAAAGQDAPEPSFMYAGPGDQGKDPGGAVTLSNSLIRTSPNSGSILVAHSWSGGVDPNGGVQPPTGTKLKLTNTASLDLGNAAGTYKPFTLQADGFSGAAPVSEYGGVVFSNFLMVTDQAPPFMQAIDDTTAHSTLANLSGTLTVVDPSGVSTSLGSSPRNITFAITHMPALPAATVSVAASAATVAAGAPIQLTFTRASADVSAPLPVSYAVGGTAGQRYDFDGLPGAAVIPAGQSSVTVSFGTRRPDTGTDTRTVSVTIQPDSSYTVGSPAAATISIT
ncbi:right-handed parallel beta-helix repeat-containing protein [Catenulispora sp. NF23]|uniref:Right-handed parallel beta-helix repeat-containing protein n=1 Tax=Catenulispora pinistramenti TaxID=2705254 RepID=A0ABS5KPM9_9ACTN|nr:right-handed parallel beta-helix repeat-containing protein [Catenulispora pinistramenti]MBS2535202.1 right-handed parallel beta-helix repeat-containing protein [Catenulispora pinistramenti]MBS2548006.1 right-handed parallel beta-helix repeat-containing protein [Catenulispora pinistramenti]